MTQIVFDLDVLDRFAEILGGWPVPVLAGIFPLTSYRLALRLHNEVPGIIVPDALQQALDEAGADAATVGMAHAQAPARRRRASAATASTSSRRTASRPRCSSYLPEPRFATAGRDGERRELLLDAEDVVRRRDLVQPLQHLRLAHLAPHLRVARDLERDGADDPAEREPPDRADARARRASRARWSGGSRWSPPRIVSREHARDAAGRRRRPTTAPTEPDERRVARVGSGREEVRREPRADDRARRQPDERRSAVRDQPAPVAAERRQARRPPR